MALIVSTTAQAQFRLPAQSPVQTLRQDFGTGFIEVTYSRPGVKDRTIFGGLLPYSEIWRTGANAATLVRFSAPVVCQGQALDSGTYALFTIPDKKQWTLIFNRNTKAWGTGDYKESDDVLRCIVPVTKRKVPVETFTIQIGQMRQDQCELQLTWENTEVNLPITCDSRPRLREQLGEALRNQEKKPFWQAAQYYRDYEKDNTKALEFVNMALEVNPKAPWIWLYKAKVQRDLGDISGATASSNRSTELARADNDEEYVRLNQEFMKTLKKKN